MLVMAAWAALPKLLAGAACSDRHLLAALPMLLEGIRWVFVFYMHFYMDGIMEGVALAAGFLRLRFSAKCKNPLGEEGVRGRAVRGAPERDRITLTQPKDKGAQFHAHGSN